MRMIALPGAIVVLLLVALGSARAEDAPVVAQSGDLEVRILPSETADSAVHQAAVARPLEIRFELRNRGNDPLLLPLKHGSFLLVRIWYQTPEKPPVLFGRAWGPAPHRSALVEIPPGEARIETRRLHPTMTGDARVVVQLSSSYTQVSEYVPVRRETTEGGLTRVHCEWQRVDEPRLWNGGLKVSAPLRVAHWAGYQDGDAVDARRVSELRAKKLDDVDRLAVIDEVAVLDRTERAVNLLRGGLPPAYTRQGPSRLERWLRTKHLVVAARRGYGYRALPHLLRIVEEEEEHLDVRLMALEGAALLLDDYFLLRTDDDVYRFLPPAPVQDHARLVFAELSTGEGELARRAKEIIEARTNAE